MHFRNLFHRHILSDEIVVYFAIYKSRLIYTQVHAAVYDGFISFVHVYKKNINVYTSSWWRGTVVERRSLAGELSLSCARPAADG